MKKLFLLLLVFVFTIPMSIAQTKRITGKVTSEGEPIPGANILEKGTTNGTITDLDGNYAIEVPQEATLVFSFIGLETKEIPVGDASVIDVSLDTDVSELEEVVVVGYSSKKKADLTGAVAVVDVEQATQEPNANILQSLQGRVPGLNITTNGAPGTDAFINIRGFGSPGNNSPLFIIDGVPTQTTSGLNPNDIASIQVLKDAASASIYGARANNGVIIITTKKGDSEDVKITVNAYAGIKWRRDKLDMLNAEEFGQVLFQALRNDGLPTEDAIYGNGPDPVIPTFLDDAMTIPSADTDWQDEVYDPSYNQSYNLGISKQADQSNFYLGLEYTKEDGIAEYTNFERYAARINTSFNLSDRLTVGEHLSISRILQVRNPGALQPALFQHPIIPLKDNAGNFGGPVKNLGDRLNPVGLLFRNKDNEEETWRLFGDVFVNLEIIEGLNFKTTAGIDYSDFRLKRFEPTFVEGRFTNAENRLTETSTNDFNTVVTSTLNYTWSNEVHSFDILGGVERVHNTFETFGAIGRNFFLEEQSFRFLDAAGQDDNNFGGGAENGLLSQFGKVDYTLLDRYLLSVTVRRDGSSRFGEDNQWGVFPAVSTGWRIDQESFFPDIGFLSNAKLRFSWGENGNQEIGDFSFATFFASNPDFSNYDIIGSNTSSRQGFIVSQIGNRNIKWETARQTNIGLDLGLFDNRLQFTTDYFIKNTEDLLVNPLLVAVQGEGAPPFINAGDIQNKGIELLISYRNTISDFNYNIDFTLTAIDNEVQSIGEDGDDEIIGDFNRITPGEPVGEFFGWITDGIFQNQGEVDAHADQPGKGIGRIRFRDVDQDGDVDEDDRTFIGTPHPDFTFGVNFGAGWRNFDLSLFIDGSVGNDIWDRQRFITHSFLFNSNHGTVLLDAWTPDNTDTDIPGLSTQNPNDELRPSTFFLDDGDFVRLKSISLGYTLPQSLLESVGIGKARIYIQGQNLVNITGFDGLDYEPITSNPLRIGVLEEDAYPHSKSVTLGINVEF